MRADRTKGNGAITIAEAEKRHHNEWVVMEVTHADKLGFAKKGRIIDHGPDKSAVVEAGLAFREKNTDAHLCLFYAGPVIPEGINAVLQWPAA